MTTNEGGGGPAPAPEMDALSRLYAAMDERTMDGYLATAAHAAGTAAGRRARPGATALPGETLLDRIRRMRARRVKPPGAPR
jgi:hypothetical protein